MSVMVTSPQGDLTPYGVVPKYQRFRVVGIFHSGFYQYDSSYGFIRLSDAQKLFGEPDLVSIISFRVDDLYRANGSATRSRTRRARASRPRTGWSRIASFFAPSSWSRSSRLS